MIDELAQAYRDEETRLHKARLAAWCSVGDETEIAGIECKPLTARAYIDLQLADSPFVIGEDPTIADAAVYIWRSSRNFRAGDDWRTLIRREKCIKRLSKANEIEVITGAYEHLSEAFDEMPRSVSTGGGGQNNRFPDVEGIVSTIDELAARYGTSPDTVIDWPLNRIFQLQKALRLATIPEYKMRQPESLMRLRREYLKEINTTNEWI